MSSPRQLVIAAAIAAVVLRLMRDGGQGGVAQVRKSARSYFAIGIAAGIAGLAVDVFPPAGTTAAGLLVITVALSSIHQGAGNTWFDDLTNKALGGPLPGLGGGIPYGAPGFPPVPGQPLPGLGGGIPYGAPGFPGAGQPLPGLGGGIPYGAPGFPAAPPQPSTAH